MLGANSVHTFHSDAAGESQCGVTINEPIRNKVRLMNHSVIRSALALAALAFGSLAQAQSVEIFNTVKLKLAAGQKVVGVTVATSDPDIYCASISSGSRCSTAR